MERSAIVISASSDSSGAITQRWMARGWKVFGTYRTRFRSVVELERLGMNLVSCDLADPASIRDARAGLQGRCPKRDVLVMCPSK